MGTAIVIDSDVLEAARALARDEKRSVGVLVTFDRRIAGMAGASRNASLQVLSVPT